MAISLGSGVCLAWRRRNPSPSQSRPLVRLSAALSLVLVWLCISVAGLRAEDPDRRYVPPRDFGFEIPPGAARPGNGQRVTTTDVSGEAVVALVHADVGQQRLVMLPDGQIVARPANDAQDTERPFTPLKKAELIRRLRTGKLDGFKTKDSKHYIFLFNTSDEFALATTRILESMFPGIVRYAQAQKLEVREPIVPLVVIMFKTSEEFQAYQRMPDGVVAYYEPVSNHVVMYEQSKFAEVKPELAIQQSISTIAHEGVHQILHNIGVQQRLSVWPMWLSEGLAEYFAPTSTGKRLRWKGAGQINDMRMFELEQFLKGRDADSPQGDMIERTVVAARLSSTGYASAWALTHFLAKTYRDKLDDYIREVARLGPLECPGNVEVSQIGDRQVVTFPANSELFRRHFGEDLAAMEKKLVGHLKRQPYDDPLKESPHFVAMLEIKDGRKVRREANIFHTVQLAERWTNETLRTVNEPARNSAQRAFRALPNRAAAEQFAKTWMAGR